MLDVLHFIFQDFSHYIGTAFLLIIICRIPRNWFSIRHKDYNWQRENTKPKA